MKNKIRMAIVDDHSLMREGLAKILQMESGFEVVKKASDGMEIVSELEGEKEIDVLLLDINLPQLSGIEVLKKIRKSGTDIKVIMLTIHDDREYLLESLNAGANGYVLKDAQSDDLIRAIETVYSGGSYVHPSLAGELFHEMNRQRVRKETGVGNALTKRESEVLCLIAKGQSNKGISDKLHISEKTVKNHVSSILRKLHLQDRTQAAIYAIKMNYDI
ncbi:MAG: response regulator transcription factor [Peptostreptococcaceae bacterium]|nr:response regulator transcription factor [Peptostreptococcaceae bacterium]